MQSMVARKVISIMAETVPGPGSYDPDFHHQVLHGFAPFGTTAFRHVVSPHRPETPGPGAYSPTSPLSPAPKGPTAAFASRMPRLRSDLLSAKVANGPAPGSYDVRKDLWPSKPLAVVAKPLKSVCWTPMHTTPSIPSLPQRSGYSMEPTGALLLRTADDEAGGGRQGSVRHGSPADLLIRYPRAPAPTFGRDKAQRNCFGLSKDTLELPGPGAYDVQKAPSRIRTRPPTPSVPRTRKAKELGPTPGPGSYEVTPARTPKQEKASQAFGSTCPQPFKPLRAQHLPLLQSVDTPGPGAYDVAWAQRPSGPEPHAAFVDGVPRFAAPQANAAATPGPGHYADNDIVAIEKQGRVVGRYGVFGSTAPRFVHLDPEETPGPGAYDRPPPPRTRRLDPRSAIFASRTSRFAARSPGGSPAEPPPPLAVHGTMRADT